MQLLANYIIRPHREVYDVSDLGFQRFSIGKVNYNRKDFQVPSTRGFLQCSWYDSNKSEPKKCIIYCHGNCGCRLDAYDILEFVLKAGMSLICFDFGGCGLSDGDYVTLGFFEKNDLKAVVKYVKLTGKATHIGIWGRSMGAVAAILYSEGLKNAPPLVLDSPFACLTEVIDDMIKRYKLVPNLIKEFLLKRITEHIKDVACFDLNNINPISTAKKCRNSAIFVHSFEDRLVNIDHSRKLYIEWAGSKHFITVNGMHNSMRGPETITRTLNILDSMMGKPLESPDCMLTERLPPPEFSKKATKLIKHRRYQSQDYQNVYN